jgi:hypothetical protein
LSVLLGRALAAIFAPQRSVVAGRTVFKKNHTINNR